MKEKNKKIHVGFLTERMLRGFGVDVVIDKTAKELVKNGFIVTVFCINIDDTYTNDYYKIVQICSGLYHNPLKTSKSAKKALRRLNQETDIDIWIAEAYPFFLASKIMDRPVIIVDHGVVSTKGMHLLKRIIFAYIKFIQNYFYFPRAIKIVSISKFIQSLTPKLLRKKQEIIYNGADNYETLNVDETNKFKSKHQINQNEIVLLYVGRINNKNQPYKGTQELVKIFKLLRNKYPKTKLIMAGFGDEKDKEWLKKEGVIPFISPNNKTVSFLYSIADIYITASKWEGFNLPLVESGYFGVPFVAYDIGAHKEVVDDKSGYLVKNKYDFFYKIEDLIKNKQKRIEMGKNAIKNSSRFVWKKVGIDYKNLIERTLNLSRNKFFTKKYEDDLVDVITLNYNGKGYLKNFFTSLRNQTYKKIKITMVDNGSTDESTEYVRESFPWVNLIRSEKNLFFSRGNNLAVSKTKGEYIFFVNNDIVLDPNVIKEMIDVFNKKGKYNIASVGAKMVFYNNKNIFDSVGIVITGNGSPFNRGIGQIDIGQYDRIEEIFGACFGAVLIRRNVYEKIVGPLDNSYFGYFEDVDWNYRARILGYKSYFCPLAKVYHDHSGTSKKFGYEWKYYLIHRNFLKTIIKNFQLKRMIFKAGWKTLELINHLIKTKNKERKLAIIKIIFHIFYSLPRLFLKRIDIQLKRCKSDHECIKFSEGENSFFDAVNYQPILTLDTLAVMFSRLDMLNNFENQKISNIVSKINYLNERKTLMKESFWENETQDLIKSLEEYIGRDYVEKFIDGVVNKKIWKK